jgi:hypothetical protein
MPASRPRSLPLLRSAVAAVAAAACTACLDTSTLITVKPDGSGTIQQRILVSTDGLEDALSGMGFKNKGSSRSATSSGGPKAGDLRADPAGIGDGVTLVSVEPVTAAAGFEGAVATYSFRDIRKVKADRFLMPGPAGGPGGGADDRTAFTFATTPGGTALLSVAFDDRPGRRTRRPAAPHRRATYRVWTMGLRYGRAAG